MLKNEKFAIFLMFLVVLASFSCVYGVNAVEHSTIYVSPNGSDFNDGYSEVQAKKTIENAVSVAGPDTEIVVKSGTYHVGFYISGRYANRVWIDRKIRLVGEKKESTFIDGWIGVLEDSKVEIDGFTISGDGIRNKEGNLTVTNSIFSNNKHNDGGALYTYKGTLSVINCTFISNYSNRGGAIYCDCSHCSLLNNLFQCNVAEEYGGAIYNEKSDIDVKGNIFKFNKAKKGRNYSDGKLHVG
jgi:predicted outer membrane repeat protein